MGSFVSWRSAAPLAHLELGDRVRRCIRYWMHNQGLLEVVTPAMSQSGATDPALASYTVSSADSSTDYYLHTSPESAMKRLLAQYRVDIYQIASVFRAGESGRRHNPEFSLLEWYRVGYDHHALISDVSALLAEVHTTCGRRWVEPRRVSYAELVGASTGIDIHENGTGDIRAFFHRHNRHWPTSIDDDRDAALDLLLDTFVLPTLPADRATVVVNYPASQAALARTATVDNTVVAERFELYIGTLELANGFHELCDPIEQRRRMETDRQQRVARGLPDMPIDAHLLDALAAPLPNCAGVALGVDRLIMLLAEEPCIERVLSFDITRA